MCREKLLYKPVKVDSKTRQDAKNNLAQSAVALLKGQH